MMSRLHLALLPFFLQSITVGLPLAVLSTVTVDILLHLPMAKLLFIDGKNFLVVLLSHVLKKSC